jgi:PmbA protein
MEIRSLARKALATARREGASQAEAFAVSTVTRIVYVDDSRIKISEEKADQGLALRVLKGRKLAQATSSCSTAEEAEACARTASRLADRSPQTRNYEHLPDPSKALLAVNNWDEAVATTDPVALAELMKAAVAAALDHGVKVPKAMLRTAVIEATVMNTNDLEVTHSSTLVFADLNAMAEGPSPGEGIGNYSSPWLKGFDPVRMGEQLARQAKAAREARPLEGSLKVPVLIAPGELAELIKDSAGFALSAESVNKKRSVWSGREGQPVASEQLTLIDDPSDPRGVLSADHDDEGVPATVKPLVEHGVLRSFLYDSYNAALAGKAPSGNGMRRRALDAQYLFQSPLGCGHLNLVVKPGTRSCEQMIASLDEGVLVEKFAYPTVDPYSGAFALEARLAHVIRGGAIVGHIKQALVVGNMYEGLKHVREVGADAVTVGSAIVPTMAFDGFEVVGSK